MTINPITFQTLADALGPDQAIRQCAPTAFYMVLSGAGYIPVGESLTQLCIELRDEGVFTDAYQAHNWSRPALSQYLRRRYQAQIVSWQIHWPPPQNMVKMRQAGYIETDREERFFAEVVEGHTVQELVSQGYPVIITVNPNFAGMGNTSVHAVIILEWNDQEVKIIDPDGRNTRSTFASEVIEQSISVGAAGTIILPKHV